jgi:hypothetical protein
MVSQNLSTLFQSLDSAATELNQISDSINTSLETVEKKLNSLNIGFDIWHPYPVSSRDLIGGASVKQITTEIVGYFGFATVDGRWCLAYKQIRRESGFFEGYEDQPFTNEYSEGQVATLMRQSREIRTNSLEAMPDFLALVVQRMQEKARKLAEAKQQLGL